MDVRGEMKALRRLGVPRSFIPVAHDGTGYYFYLLADDSAAGAAKSVIVSGPGRNHVKLADGFFEFLRLSSAAGGAQALVRDEPRY